MNTHMIDLPSLEAIKDQAKRLRADLAKTQTVISHSKSLELVAHQLGHRDWNTLRAAIGNQPPTFLRIGQKVSGKYLGQAFEGDVIGLQSLADGQKYRLTLHLDEPIDVVKFESFSALRHRINCTIDRSGKTFEKTSDGMPHLVLSL